ncbi:MAG: response regulator [Fibrobacterales bacterium]
MRVFVLESNRKLLLHIRNVLASAGFHPVTSSDFAELIEALQLEHYSAIIIDCTLFPQETLDFIHTIRDIEQNYALKIFILSPKPSKEYALNLIKAGVDGFIIKPIIDDQFELQFLALMNEYSHENRRRYVRVTPRKQKKALAKIVSPYTGNLIESRIFNISIGGMAVHIDAINTETESLFQVNDVIRNVKMYLDTTLVISTIQVIGLADGRLGVLFIDLEESAKTILCNYIMETIELSE